MRVGAGPIDLVDLGRDTLRSLAERAASASFDALWLSESRTRGIGGGIAAAAMAAQWTPIRVGAVVDAALYHPLHLAEDIAVADLSSRGRLEVMLRFRPPPAGYPIPANPKWDFEWLDVVCDALAGAHLDFSGEHVGVPGHLEDNQPAPQRLALNPAPAQPAVPIWVMTDAPQLQEHARRVGFGLASVCTAGGRVSERGGRWPSILMCDAAAEPDELLSVAGPHPVYFLIDVPNPAELAAVGRRLVGPLRMPEFPDWVLA